MEKKCVHCGESIEFLYKEYSKGNIRLTHCIKCNHVADDYIECEFVLVFLDLILHKIQAYRHILFNRAPFCELKFNQLAQLSVCLCLLDAVITVEQNHYSPNQAVTIWPGTSLTGHDPNALYVLSIVLTAAAAFVEHIVFVVLAVWITRCKYVKKETEWADNF